MDIDAAVKGMGLAFQERQRTANALREASEKGIDAETRLTLSLDWELAIGKVSGYRAALADLLGNQQMREIEETAKAALEG